MSTIILDERQSQVVATSSGTVEVLDANGGAIGTLTKGGESDVPVELDEETVRELIRRMSMKDIQWRTTAEVLASLEALGDA